MAKIIAVANLKGGGTSGRLHCTDASPVLHRLALYWVRSGLNGTSNESLNGQFVKSDTVFGGEQVFPGPVGVKTYYMEDPLWRVGSNRMLFGLSDTALSSFIDKELKLAEDKQSTAGDGLSAFTTMQFDVSGFRTSVSPQVTSPTGVAHSSRRLFQSTEAA